MNELTHLETVGQPYAVNTIPPEGCSQNVIDKYKGMTHENIMADLDTRRNQMVSVFYNTGSDFNLATAIRSSNSFAGRAVVICNRKRYDRRGTVGTHNYHHAYYVPEIEDAIAALHEDGYTVIAVDNLPEFNPQPVDDFEFPHKSAFVYGEEGSGLPREVNEVCDSMVYIKQFGSVRSLNVSTAATVMMFAYTQQWPNDGLFT